MKILASFPQGLTPKEVVEEFRRQKIAYKGRTALQIRIPNELSRLKKVGRIDKRQDGRYRKK